LVLFGFDLTYLMGGCLAASLITDIVDLKGYAVFTLAPLMAGLFYRFLYGTLNEAAIALVIPFIFNFIPFITRRLAPYDILELGMIGVIMGWPFGLATTAAAKVLNVFTTDPWVVKLLGRPKGEDIYAFPFMIMIVPGAIFTYCLFEGFPESEKVILDTLDPLISWLFASK
jgi:hypothetical protein